MDALGYERFNLYGLSYGTRVALTALRDLPAARIRSVVLDSAVPPQRHLVSGGAAAALEYSLERMFADCAASPACLAAYPDLEATTSPLLARHNAPPLALAPTGPDGPFHVVLTGDRLLRLINIGLQSNSLIPFVPLLIASTARGDTFLLSIALGGLAEPDPTSVGLAHAVLCNEETPFNDAAAMAAAERGVDPRLLPAMTADPRGSSCPWDEPPVDPIENQPVHSDVPVLVLAGEYDSSTPPAWNQLAASTLSRSTYVEFRGFGHAVLGQDLTPSATPCAMQVIADFIADPAQALDRACVDALAPPVFLAD
jgi:pimeloyl-ACP methyl ester carboxylesterase